MSPRDEHPLVGLIKRPLRALRSYRDRSRHPSRRKRAEAVVAGVGQPRMVLFLCTGNICRSPYAEKVFRRAIAAREGARIEAASAGFLAPGRPSPEAALRIARERGIALEAHRSRTADGDLLAKADVVVAMEMAHEEKAIRALGRTPAAILLLGDLDPELPTRREIQDPWGHDDGVFKASFERIDRCVARLEHLLRSGGSGTPGNAHRASD